MVLCMTQKITELVRQLYSKGKYRPEGVAVLHNGYKNNRKFLIVQSSKSSNAWYFPQGGINLGETLSENLSRELAEELGLNFENDLKNLVYNFHYEILDAKPSRKTRRGFAKGKAFFFTLAEYHGSGQFNLQHDEIADAKWMVYNEAIECFNIGRPEKAALSKRGLDKAIEILEDNFIN